MPEPARTDAATSPTGRDGHGRSGALGVIVLAAGEGTRMKSARPKVLHAFAGRTMLGHVLAATAPLRRRDTVVVVGHGRDQVTAHLAELDPRAVAAVQHEQRGTGHAVRIALDARGPRRLRHGAGAARRRPAAARRDAGALLAEPPRHRGRGHDAHVRPGRPDGYGRVLRAPDGTVARVVEHRDARGRTAGHRGLRAASTPSTRPACVALLGPDRLRQLPGRAVPARRRRDPARGRRHRARRARSGRGDGGRQRPGPVGPGPSRRSPTGCSTGTCAPGSPWSTRARPGWTPTCASTGTSPCCRACNCTPGRRWRRER